MSGLPDYLNHDMLILFIGYNPGMRSAELGHHYAGKGNGFFPLLFSSGLIKEKLTYKDDVRLLPEYGYGLTNIVSRPTVGIKDLSKHEYREGRDRLIEIFKEYQPRIAAYVGIGVYKNFSGRSNVKHGRQENSTVDGVIDYVLPSTSGLNCLPYKEKEEWFKKLRELKEKGKL